MHRRLAALTLVVLLGMAPALALGGGGSDGGQTAAPAEPGGPAPVQAAPAAPASSSKFASAQAEQDLEKPGPWSRQAIDLGIARGWFVGFEDSTFRWKENVTREQLAVVLFRMITQLELDKVSQEDLAVLAKAITELKAEMAAMRDRLTTVEERLAALQDLSDQMSILMVSLDTLQGLTTDLQTRVETLEGVKVPPDSSQDVQTLFEAMADLQNQVAILQGLVAGIEVPAPVDLSGINATLAQLQAQIAALNQEKASNVDLKALYDDLTILIDLQDQAIGDLQTQMGIVLVSIDTLQSQTADLDARVSALEAIKIPPDSSQDVQTIFDALADLQNQVVTLQAAVAGIEIPAPTDLSGVNASLADLKAQIDALKAQVAAIANKPDATDYSTDINTLYEAVSILQTQVENAVIQIAEIRQENVVQDERLARLEAALAALQAQIQSAQITAEINRLAQRLTELEAALRTQNTNIEALRTEQRTLREQLTALIARVGTLEGSLQALVARVTTLEGRATTLEGRATALEGRVTALEGRVTTLTTDLAAVRTAADAAVQRANAAASAVAALDARVGALDARLTALEGRVSANEQKDTAQDRSIADILARLAALERDNAQLKAANATLEKDLAALKLSNQELRDFVLPARAPFYVGLAGYQGDVTNEFVLRFSIGHDSIIGNLGLRASYELPLGPSAPSISGDFTYRISQGAIDGYFGAGYGVYMNAQQTPFGQIHVGVGYRVLYNLSLFFEGTQRYLFDGSLSQRSSVMLGVQARF